MSVGDKARTLRFMDGNEAVAWAAYYSGCRYFAGYPITPATGVFNAMLDILPRAGGQVLQGEDEIASIGACIGASMAGVKAMTATSGPGISLYSEHLSFATGSEIPLVIVNVQRLGPSTGSATKGADGDVQFMRWNSSGGLPVVVLCPIDVRDAFVLTMQAFNLAERFRCPVFVASNKEIALTRESVDLDSVSWPVVQDRVYAPEEHFLPFAAHPGQPPGFLPLGHPRVLVRQTSSTHGEDGYITVDPARIQAMHTRLRQKIDAHVREMSFSAYRGPSEADVVIVAYGVTARTALAAYRRLVDQGRSVGLLILKTLWPVLEEEIASRCRSASRVIVPEMNLGLYAREIERILPGKEVQALGQMNGNLLTPDQILEVAHA
ncbi:transketolase C-terminal domain-containing protein [Desulfovermiculus halophilus]|uniref:transketolase C-terminal domain-containing protein n=1 Tax=Desulfovermiculus halophilus TaxID=339722 RepID=UPI00047F8081|nr:transketolase C-terminal domain-containing protein [Desulfovermiculus halophilus]